MKKALLVLLVLVAVQGLAQKTTSDSTVIQQALSPDILKGIFSNESRVGGQLDDFTAIKGHENDPITTKSGNVTTKLADALMRWSSVGFSLGLAKVDDVLDVWQKLKGRPATQKEKEYIIKGFRKKQ